MPWKELLLVGGAAAAGEWARNKYGVQIEQKAVEMRIPPTVAHASVVAAFACAGYALGKMLF